MARTPELPNAAEVMDRLGEVTQANRDFPLKVNRNTDAGLLAYKNGINSWEGFPEEPFSRKITFQGIFDVESANEVISRISDPLAEIGERHGVQVITPNRRDRRQRGHDLPPHFTFQFPHFVEGTEPEVVRQTTEQLTRPGSELHRIAQSIQGSTIPFDRLVLAGQMLYMCVGDPTKNEATFSSFWEIQEARRKMNTVFDASPIKMINPTYHDIIHSGVGRIIRINKGANLEAFAEEAYARVGEPLQQKPINASMTSVHIGNGRSQILSVNEQLLKRA